MRNTYHYLFIILLFTFISSSKNIYAASECSEVINQNEAVNLENARDQDSIGWCYAYAAADLLSFKLKKKVSAVSLNYSKQGITNELKSANSTEGSDPKTAIDNYYNKKSGFCLEDNLASSDFAFCTHNNYRDFINELLSSVQNKSVNDLECLEKNILAAFPLSSLDDMLSFSDKYGSQKLIEYLYDKHCKPNLIKNFKPDIVSYNTTRMTPENSYKIIDSKLNAGEIISIGYKYELVDPGFYKGDHASIIVGRRFNQQTNKCEYLLRNSWGKSCNQNEGPEISCHQNCANGECRYSGHFWVSKDLLGKSLIEVTVFR